MDYQLKQVASSLSTESRLAKLHSPSTPNPSSLVRSPKSWLAMYSAITSSVTFPELAAKYPRAQRCLPQNCFLSTLKSSSIRREVRPLMLCSTLDSDKDGGTLTNKWTWSLLTCPLRIWTSKLLQHWRINSRHRRAISPVNTGLRYFVIQTTWNFRS